LQIHSDYGDYQYRWGSPGEDFKVVLISLDDDYLMTKLAGDSWFDEVATVKACKAEIFSRRKSEVIDHDLAREAYDDLSRLTGAYDLSGWQYEFLESNALSSVFYDLSDAPICTDHPPQVKMFMARLWPDFVEALCHEH
jgi:hypothetical protein